MKRVKLHRIVPAALMAVATAIPVATTVEILAHVSTEQAAAPAPSTSSSTTTSSAAPAPATATATTAPATPTTAATSTASSSARSVPTATAAPATSTPVATATQPAATATATTRTYVGPVEYDQFGAVQATITVAGGKVTAVTITAPEDNPRSAAINEQAIPILQSETLQAQSASIDLVSGATYTSQAYEQYLQAALDQAHIA